MKKILSVIPGFIVFLILAVVGLYFSLGNKLLVKEVVVSISPHSQETSIFEEIKSDMAPRLEKLIGERMVELSFGELAEELLKDKRIKDLHLRREFPHTVSIQIEPQEPVLGWVDEKGFIRAIARDSQVLPRLKSSPMRDLALLRGKEFLDSDELRKAALDLILQLPEEGSFRRALVSEIRYSKASGFDFILSEPSVTVKMGKETHPTRVARLEKVLNYMQNRGIRGRVIDSRFDKKVVVRLRNEP